MSDVYNLGTHAWPEANQQAQGLASAAATKPAPLAAYNAAVSHHEHAAQDAEWRLRRAREDLITHYYSLLVDVEKIHALVTTFPEWEAPTEPAPEPEKEPQP